MIIVLCWLSVGKLDNTLALFGLQVRIFDELVETFKLVGGDITLTSLSKYIVTIKLELTLIWNLSHKSTVSWRS
jgi:hypothetical protein